MYLLFFFQRPDLVDDDLPIFVQPNIVSIEEGFAFNKLSSIYVLLVGLVSFDYRHWQRLAILGWILTPSWMTLNFLVWMVCNHYQGFQVNFILWFKPYTSLYEKRIACWQWVTVHWIAFLTTVILHFCLAMREYIFFYVVHKTCLLYLSAMHVGGNFMCLSIYTNILSILVKTLRRLNLMASKC